MNSSYATLTDAEAALIAETERVREGLMRVAGELWTMHAQRLASEGYEPAFIARLQAAFVVAQAAQIEADMPAILKAMATDGPGAALIH